MILRSLGRCNMQLRIGERRRHGAIECRWASCSGRLASSLPVHADASGIFPQRLPWNLMLLSLSHPCPSVSCCLDTPPGIRIITTSRSKTSHNLFYSRACMCQRIRFTCMLARTDPLCIYTVCYFNANYKNSFQRLGDGQMKV
jgi:hypothetical protein